MSRNQVLPCHVINVLDFNLREERTRAGLAAALAQGRFGGRPRKMDKATLTMAMAMADHKSVAAEVAKRLGITTTTLYAYVNGDGTPKELGHKLLQGP